MKKIYTLSTCDTCRKIISELQPDSSFHIQDIKKQNITADELDGLKHKSDSYESLFNKRAMKFRDIKKNLPTPSEEDYRKLILSDYTFLKRPVICINNEIFIGNAKETIAGAIKAAKKN